MAGKQGTGRKKGGNVVGDHRELYRGHEIIIPTDERRKRIFIDGRPVKWGETGGTYYLDVYAYDRGRTLDETIKRYIDSLENASSNAGKEVE
jgi:hypothetical protein